LRLTAPAAVTVGHDAITVSELIISPTGLELTLELKIDPGRNVAISGALDQISIRMGDVDHRIEPSSFSVGSDPRGFHWRIGSPSTIELEPGVAELCVIVPELGEVRVQLWLEPVSNQEFALKLDSETVAEHDGVVVAVRHIAITPSYTAVDLQLSGTDRIAGFMGVGGFHGLRLGGTALRLRDETGRTYAERLGMERARRATFDRDYAMFEPLAPDSHLLELEIPYVFLEEFGTLGMSLPMTNPLSAVFGSCDVRVMSARRTRGAVGARNAAYLSDAVAVRFDNIEWTGNRRLLMPARASVDGVPTGVRLLSGIECSDPEPMQYLEVPLTSDADPTRVTLAGPVIQVRGPWIVLIKRPDSMTRSDGE
jgi:hypothetical protein